MGIKVHALNGNKYINCLILSGKNIYLISNILQLTECYLFINKNNNNK